MDNEEKFIKQAFTHEELIGMYILSLKREQEKDAEIKELKLTINEIKNDLEVNSELLIEAINIIKLVDIEYSRDIELKEDFLDKIEKTTSF